MAFPIAAPQTPSAIYSKKVRRPHGGPSSSSADTTVIARAANLIVGCGAYEAACGVYPKARLTLRQGIRVIDETEG